MSRARNSPTLLTTLLALMLLATCTPADPPHDPGLEAITVVPTQPTPTPSSTPQRALVTMTPVETVCPEEEVAAILRDMPPYNPGGGAFVLLDEEGFWLEGERFIVRGVNYYPARSPWQRFPLTDLGTIERDFARLQAANVNTVRLFVWPPPYFVCPGSGAVPNAEAFLWLDAVLRLANAYGFRVILVLHDQPDLTHQPLYDNLHLTLPQTAFIVTRYRDEPTLLAWDLRDAGDRDYTPFSDEPAPFTREVVLDWLSRTAVAVRQIDTRHPITAGWADDSEATISLVDFVSFQHFEDDQSLRERVATLRTYTAKPLLLTALGISTFTTVTEAEQAQRLRTAVRTAEGDGLAGWLVWTMYDFPTDVTCYPEPCASLDDARHHYGLWRGDGARKPAANALETLAAGP